jgi:mannosyltransferase OCH1-like enzyme
MIPSVIHYCWFGNNPKSKDIEDCIASWKKHNPDFEIKEWNELNFPVERFPFASRCYDEKKWAFVSDYARLSILNEHGGFYLDTDMLLLQSLTSCQGDACSVGEESPGILNAAYFGAEKGHPFVKACLEYYDTNPQTIETIPRVMTRIYLALPEEIKKTIRIYPAKTFYPFTMETIKQYRGQDLGADVLGVHLWNYSWGHPLNRFFKKLGIYSLGKRVTETLGVKQVLKKLFGFI